MNGDLPRAPTLKFGRTNSTSLDLAYRGDGLILAGLPPVRLSLPIITMTGNGVS